MLSKFSGGLLSWALTATYQAAGATPGLPAPAKISGMRGLPNRVEGIPELIDMNYPASTGLAVIAAAVSEKTGRNIIMDPTLKGREVQIIAPQLLTPDDAWETFISALDLSGLSTVETGRVTKIILRSQGIRGNPPLIKPGGGLKVSDQLVTQVVPLKYVDAKQILSALSRFVTPGSMVALPSTNHLIISDSAEKVRRVLDMITLMDVRAQHSGLKIFPVRYGQASLLKQALEQIMGARNGISQGRGPLKRGGGPEIRLLSDDQHSLIAAFAPDAYLHQIAEYLRQLDVPSEREDSDSVVTLVPLEYADAGKLAATLSALSGSFIGTRALSGSGSSLDNNGKGAPGGFKVAVDRPSNSLIITGSRAVRESLEYVIRKFDIRQDQVLIEAQILAVGTDHRLRLGSSLLFGHGRPDGAGTKVITGWEAGDMSSVLLSGSEAFASQGSEAKSRQFVGGFTSDLTIGVLAASGVQVPGLGMLTPGALMRLVRTDEDTRVLAAPWLLSADHGQAELSVGQTIFFRASNLQNLSGSPTSRLEKENIELSLKVTPSLSLGSYVSLDLQIDANQLAGISPEGLPSITRRSIRQKLSLRDGQTAVIAGLREIREISSVSKVPFLGDLPLVNVLFRKKSRSFQEQQLAIFLTVWSVKKSEDLAKIYRGKLKESLAFLRNSSQARANKSELIAELPDKDTSDYEKSEFERWEDQVREGLRRESRKAVGYE